jgi:putative transposase
MSRMPRVHIEGILYYVTQEATQNKNLFRDETDYEQYLMLLGLYKERHGFHLRSYVLTPNQVHLVIEPNVNATVSKIMRDLTPRYTKFYNARYLTNGPLFQGRFKATLIEKETHLYDLVRHLYGLPKHFGLCEDVNRYPYSSHPFNYASQPDKAAHLAGMMRAEVSDNRARVSDNVLEHFDEQFKLKEYRKVHRSYEKCLSQPILGSARFIKMVQREIEVASQSKQIPRPNEIKVAMVGAATTASSSLTVKRGIGLVLAIFAALCIGVMVLTVGLSEAKSSIEQRVEISNYSEQLETTGQKVQS